MLPLDEDDLELLLLLVGADLVAVLLLLVELLEREVREPELLIEPVDLDLTDVFDEPDLVVVGLVLVLGLALEVLILEVGLTLVDPVLDEVTPILLRFVFVVAIDLLLFPDLLIARDATLLEFKSLTEFRLPPFDKLLLE